MKPLEDQTNADGNAVDCASVVIETVLLGMRTLRCEMNKGRPSEISVSQFRFMGFLKRHPGVTLSAAAEHIGLTLPSMSNAVDGLVRRGFVTREPSPEDRRCVVLTLTDEGREVFESAADATRTHVAEMLTCLDPAKREEVARSMRILREVFLSTPLGGGCEGSAGKKSAGNCSREPLPDV